MNQIVCLTRVVISRIKEPRCSVWQYVSKTVFATLFEGQPNLKPARVWALDVFFNQALVGLLATIVSNLGKRIPGLFS